MNERCMSLSANIFCRHIVSINIELRKASLIGIQLIRPWEKFDKYLEEKNNVMVLATILVPMYKMF
jgi:hypothetical protein